MGNLAVDHSSGIEWQNSAYLVLFCFLSDTKRWDRLAIRFLLVRVYHCSPCFYYYLLCLFSHSGAAADHSNGIEGGQAFVLFCFVLFHFVAQKGETDRQSVFLWVCVILTHLVSIAHPLFQVTINMSSGNGAEDASRFRRNAEAAAYVLQMISFFLLITYLPSHISS